MEENGYAPQYNFKEKVRNIGLYLIFLIPTAWFFNYHFFPWMNTTNWFLCHEYGYQILFYSLWVGFPLLFVLIYFLSQGKNSFRILKLGQYPLSQQKVYHKTKYVYGLKAKVIAYVHIMVMLVLLGSAVFGYFVTTDFLHNVDEHKLSKQRIKECN